jgi:hypothetical protein
LLGNTAGTAIINQDELRASLMGDGDHLRFAHPQLLLEQGF